MCEISADLMALIAYARVSTEVQTLEAQVRQLKAAGAEKIFKEKVSGARADRPQLKKALAAPEPDDVLLVTRLDRLARSTRDLLNVLNEIAKKGAGRRGDRVRSLARVSLYRPASLKSWWMIIGLW
jgi:DNA invertase Pin-like site-specific DNA recombinase